MNVYDLCPVYNPEHRVPQSKAGCPRCALFLFQPKMRHSRDVRLREEVVRQEGVERGYGLLRRDVEWTDVRGRGLHREHHRLRRLPSRIL